jgi:hypothetical protein
MNISLSITGLYVSLLALLYLVLSFNVIRLRYKHQVGLGDGEQKVLAKAIRIHGNFSEYIPIAILLLACYEINGAQAMYLHILGSILFIGRISHSLGLSKSIGATIERQFGMVSTFLVLLVLAVENIRLFLS